MRDGAHQLIDAHGGVKRQRIDRRLENRKLAFEQVRAGKMSGAPGEPPAKDFGVRSEEHHPDPLEPFRERPPVSRFQG